MTKGVVFFSRCRPQGSDTVDLVLRERRVFIGYPAWRKNVMPRRGHLRESVIDFQCSDEDWAPLYASFGDERREYQKNRNFIRSVKPEAIALVPRPTPVRRVASVGVSGTRLGTCRRKWRRWC
jgi:hypothetical protein